MTSDRADIETIREAYEIGGKLLAAVELRRRFPDITPDDETEAQLVATAIATGDIPADTIFLKEMMSLPLGPDDMDQIKVDMIPRRAKDNPWYRLATLHGEAGGADTTETAVKNRVAWNRWMAAHILNSLGGSLIESLLKTGRYSVEELTPFSECEQQEVKSKIGSPNLSGNIDFSYTTFEAPFVAIGLIFPKAALFNCAAFSGYTTFRTATFLSSASFLGADFAKEANFQKATFSRVADFTNATFCGDANFRAPFSQAIFQSATFTGNADFQGASFSRANFGRVTFSKMADFKSATFAREVLFNDAEMKSMTVFDHAQFFCFVPQFAGARLHEGTTWHGVWWPPNPPLNKAVETSDAYRRLRLEMDRLKNYGDELDFFARELQCQRVVLGRWRGLPLWLYGALCGYGRFYIRPLLLLIGIVLLGTIPIRGHFGGGWALSTFTDHGFTGGALGLSFANTFSALGIRKDLIDPALLQNLPGWLKVIATIQTILGIVLLFLFGLGIRNSFRIK
jgi:uncharacterized protein YjbI with pentapeptide repeats